MVRRIRKNNTGICRAHQNAVSSTRRGDVLLSQLSVVGALVTGLSCTAQNPGQNEAELVSTQKGVTLFLISDNMADLMNALTNQLRTSYNSLDG
jgi:hypothetical protein